MKIIIGLGNPGNEYADTRHNAGFLMLDKIKETWDFPPFELNKKFKAEISKGKKGNANILLVKPQAFMNLSGEPVRLILDFYKLTPEDISVIHDDLDISFGNYKIALDSQSAGHNGVQNIINNLGTQKFRRLRIGIGEAEENPLEAGDYVLQKFTPQELKTLPEILKNILDEIEKWNL